jgi:hypothetical protein
VDLTTSVVPYLALSPLMYLAVDIAHLLVLADGTVTRSLHHRR